MTAATADGSLPANIVTALYLRTKTLHVEAERTGIIRDLLRGGASREGYILLLRNLLPAYLAMEQGLERHRGSPHLGQLAAYRLDRAAAIEADLVSLCGERWSQDVPLLAAGELYAGRIAKAAEGDGARLIAHAYTRYLGDLSGGQILQRLLARSLQLRPSELSFYEFPRFSDLQA
jgi:heme oxygenase